jgi:hypothetical protein
MVAIETKTPMIDPTIAAAIVTASGGVINKLLELAGKSDPPRQAKKTIDKTYDKLSGVVTTNCVRVLIVLRKTGGKMSEGMILHEVEPMRQRQEPTSQAFENDLKYRMHFLCLLGLVQPTLSEYAITRLGVAFLAKAAGDTTNYTPAFVA